MCEKIFDNGVAHLAEMVAAASRYYEDKYAVVLGGGLFSTYPEYVDALRENVPARATLLTTDMPVVYGAALEAMRMADCTAAPGFKERFFEDYLLYKRK